MEKRKLSISKASLISFYFVFIISTLSIIEAIFEHYFVFLQDPYFDQFEMSPIKAIIFILMTVGIILVYRSKNGLRILGESFLVLCIFLSIASYAFEHFKLHKNTPLQILKLSELETVFFILNAIGVLLVFTKKGFVVGQTLILAALLLTISILFGVFYQGGLYRIITSYTLLTTTSMICYLLLPIGILTLFPNQGVPGLLKSSTEGGKMFRRLFPIGIILPIVLGWIVLGSLSNLALSQGAIAEILAFLIMVSFILASWWSCFSIAQADEERRKGRELLKGEYGILKIMSVGKTLQEIGPEILKHFCTVMEMEAGELWIYDSLINRLRCLSFWQKEGSNLSEIYKAAKNTVYEPGIEIQGFVYKTRKLFLSNDLINEPLFLRSEIGKKCQLKSIVAFPLETDKEVFGVIHLYSKNEVDPHANSFELISLVSTPIAFYLRRRQEDEARLELATIVDSTDDAIFREDLTGTIKSWNNAAQKIYGYSSDEILEKKSSLLVPKDYELEREKILETIKEGKSLVSFETFGKRKNDEIFNAAITISPIYNYDYNIIGSAVIVRDITESKKNQALLASQQKELEIKTDLLIQKNKELEQFAYIASHDLQEPLRKIVSFGELLNEKLKDQSDAEGKDYLNRMSNAAIRMRSLIESLLAYSRASRQEIIPENINLNELIAEVIDDLEVVIKQTGALIQVAILPEICADKTQMRQLFQNLLTNSIKFKKVGERPEVIIIGSEKDDSVEIVFQDKGIGFDPKYKEKIFEPFSRLANRKDVAGSGIGLSICKKIIERHHGTVSVNSKLDWGTTFLIQLPKSKLNVDKI